MTERSDLKFLCKKHGLIYSEPNPGQCFDDPATTLRVTGEHFVVDWWPFSKRRSAYVLNTQSSTIHTTAEAVVNMARTLPPTGSGNGKRKVKIASRWKARLWRKAGSAGVSCHWCGAGLTRSTTTANHRIPLHRGGLDNANNLVPACEQCNTKRGHDMPETQL